MIWDYYRGFCCRWTPRELRARGAREMQIQITRSRENQQTHKNQIIIGASQKTLQQRYII